MRLILEILFFLIVSHICKNQAILCPRVQCLVCSYSIAVCTGTCPEDIPVTVSQLTIITMSQCGAALSSSTMKSLTKLETYTVAHFSFENIASEAFVNNVRLVNMTITYGNLKFVQARAFHGLRNLKVLGLTNDTITDTSFQDISPFLTMSSLTHLRLHNNKMTTITDNLFKGLHALHELNLAYNEITHIDVDAFGELTRLRILNLMSNKLSRFSSNWLATRGHIFDVIDISLNNIATLDPTQFQQLKVNNLNLTDNPMTSVSAGSFEGIQIKNLDLRGTRHTSLPRRLRDALVVPGSDPLQDGNIFLEGVKWWNCDCYNLWLLDFLVKNPSSSSPSCGPSNMISGISKEVMKDVELKIRHYCIFNSKAPSSSTSTTPSLIQNTTGRDQQTPVTKNGTTSDDGQGLPTGVSKISNTAAIVIGVFVGFPLFFFIIALLLAVLCRRKKRKVKQEEPQDKNGGRVFIMVKESKQFEFRKSDNNF